MALLALGGLAFGAPAKAQMAALEPSGVAKPLMLFGVDPGRTVDSGRATLGAAEVSARTYVVGAVLENGARLTAVFYDRVELVREQRVYTLYLEGSERSAAVAAGTASLTIGAYEPPQPALKPPAVRGTDVLRVVPAYDGDRITGFLVYPGMRPGLFARSDLKAGDLLIAANGFALTDPSQVEFALDQLASGGTLVAEVVRNGRERRFVTLERSALDDPAVPPPLPEFPVR